MSKRVKVKLTPADIRQGRMCSPRLCPVALAIKRATGRTVVSVGAAGVTTYWRGKRYHSDGFISDIRTGSFPLPKKAITFVKRFDAGLAVAPFSFELDMDVEP